MRRWIMTCGLFVAVWLGWLAWPYGEKSAVVTAKAKDAVSSEQERSPVQAKVRFPIGQQVQAPKARAVHLVAVGKESAGDVAHVSNPGLDHALDDEEDDGAWAAQVLSDVSDLLAEDTQIDVEEVRCAQTFCRVRMHKPIVSDLDWPDVDRLLAPVARGETIFMAAPEGTMTTGFIYFSAEDSTLPLDSVRPRSEEDE